MTIRRRSTVWAAARFHWWSACFPPAHKQAIAASGSDRGPGRRGACFGALATASLVPSRRPSETLRRVADEASVLSETDVVSLDMPSFADLNVIQKYGSRPADSNQVEAVNRIIEATPTGPTPIDVAESFVRRFFATQPDVISQWPKPAAWNPLIIAFFDPVVDVASTQKTDTTAWCAAFVNWCIWRNGGRGSRSASSQSFLRQEFRRVDLPRRGDLVVFTDYRPGTDTPLGTGHVAFFVEGAGEKLVVLGGNQSGNGRSHIISRRSVPQRWIEESPKGVPIQEKRLAAYIRVGS